MTDPLSNAATAIDAHMRRADVYFAPVLACSTEFARLVAQETRRAYSPEEWQSIQIEHPFPVLHFCSYPLRIVTEREWTGAVWDQYEIEQ